LRSEPSAATVPRGHIVCATGQLSRSDGLPRDSTRSRHPSPLQRASIKVRTFYCAWEKSSLREILLLHEAEGWTYQQLSAALGITREEVATKLSAARRSLRQELGDSQRTKE
jgi:Sigma-70, region 4